MREGMKFYGFLAGIIITEIIVYLIKGECAVSIAISILQQSL